MRLPNNACEALSFAIANHVPEVTLRTVLAHLNVMTDISLAEKKFTGPLEQRYAWLAGQAVKRHNDHNTVKALADELQRRMYGSHNFASALAAIPELFPDKDLHEAFIARRDNLFLARDLVQKLDEHLPRICCIVGDFRIDGRLSTKMGTGFLVAPDMLLTARHVFEPLILSDPDSVPQAYAVFFDHVDGAPIRSHEEVRPGVRRVAIAARDWLVTSHPSLQQDGYLVNPDDTQVQDLKEHLDFALVRLAEKVGLEPISPAGGPRRFWIDFPPCDAQVDIDIDSRITIAQHPGGEPQAIDFGRVVRQCRSGTRIAYNVETAGGTSGAPCFSREFELLGFHNAAIRQGGGVDDPTTGKANQAIRFDAICCLLREHVVDADRPATASRIWDVAKRPAPPRVVFGRVRFLDWLTQSRSVELLTRVERIYAVLGPSHGAGKTFSAEILERAIADSPELVMLQLGVGVRQQRLPGRIEDLLVVLASAFRLPPGALDSMPVRPDIGLPATAVDGDKLNRWASWLVPEWFMGVLQSHRVSEKDRVAEATLLVKQADLLNVPVSDEIRRMAGAAQPDYFTHEQWRMAWIVLDDPASMGLTYEVKEFFAAMMGVGRDDESVPEVLRRIRWLYLGYRPECLAGLECREEHLQAGVLDRGDIETMAASLMASRQSLTRAGVERFVVMLAEVYASVVRVGIDPAKRLPLLQDIAANGLPAMTEYGDGR